MNKFKTTYKLAREMLGESRTALKDKGLQKELSDYLKSDQAKKDQKKLEDFVDKTFDEMQEKKSAKNVINKAIKKSKAKKPTLHAKGGLVTKWESKWG
jgi:uncharacterized ferredoxin-like protein